MTSFDQFIYEGEALKEEEIEDYINDFFNSANRDEYLVDARAKGEEIVAIDMMFEDGDDILERADKVLEKYPLCLEAAYVYYKLADEIYLNQYLNRTKTYVSSYNELSIYNKYCFVTIMHWYVDFLCNIHNITLAIRTLKAVMELDRRLHDADISRLAYLYSLIEEKDEFYNLYLEEEFKSSLPYILLIIVLLKHEDYLKAKEVLKDLISFNSYAEYIDHIWDIDDEDNEKALEFKSSLNVLAVEIDAIPYFYTWCSNNKEKVLKS